MSHFDHSPSPGYSSTSHRQLVALIADFARFSDSRQWSALQPLLAPSVSLSNPTEPPGVVLSAQQFTERWRTWLDQLGPTQHSLTIRHSAVFGTEATCLVDALITNSPDLETVAQWGGQFCFVFVQQASIWRISQLEIIPLWITEPPGASVLLMHLEQFLSTIPAPMDPGCSQEAS